MKSGGPMMEFLETFQEKLQEAEQPGIRMPEFTGARPPIGGLDLLYKAIMRLVTEAQLLRTENTHLKAELEKFKTAKDKGS
jgi:hypothetical protein